MPQHSPIDDRPSIHRAPPLHASPLNVGADHGPRWDQNRDAHFDARRELFGPYRSPGESMGMTAVVLIALSMASSCGALLIASVVSGVALQSDDADPWAGLGVLILAALFCAATVPIAATLILHVLRVPRPGFAMLATILVVLADARGPQLIFGASGTTFFASYLTTIVIASGFVGVLHPQVLHSFSPRAVLHRRKNIAS